MGLADRGGASGTLEMPGETFCRAWLLGKIGQPITVGPDFVGIVESVIDIDAIPGLAGIPSRVGAFRIRISCSH